MASLQKNINTIILKLILFSLIQSCAISQYRANKPNALGTDIVVSPDRVITECEFIDNYTGDYSDPYGFMIHLLDKENTVLTVSNGTVLEKKDCFDRKISIDKITHKAHLVTVRGRGDAEAQIVKSEFKYTFKNHGTYSSNGRSLNFLAIWNDRGQCYSAFNGEDDDCKRAQ